MNDSISEISSERSNLEREVEACATLLPPLARALNCAISELSQELQVTPAQVKVLLQLSQRQNMTVGEIAEAIFVSMPAASEIVDRLVDLGHVRRSSDLADRRRVLVSASEESQRAVARLVDLRRTQVRKALLRLPPNERPIAARTLEALISELGKGEDIRATLSRKTTRQS